MAVNNERSMNHDMMLGATDRSFHRLASQRGGQVETDMPIFRAEHIMVGSWSPPYLRDAEDVLLGRGDTLERQMFDCQLRDKVSIIT